MTLFSVCGFDLHIRSNPVEPQYIAQKIYGAKPATAPHPAFLKGNAIYEISNTHPNLAGFCSRKRMLRQLELRPKHTDRIGLFHRDAPGGRAAVRLPAPETAADAPQQVAGAAARITECREIHHPEVAARGGARKCSPTTLSTKCDGPPR